MDGNILYKVSDPVNPQDVATKEYADKMVNNIGKYVDKKNAYIKREVDDFTKLLDYVKNTVDKRPHIIMVHTSYSGPLHKNEFQFSFGGNEANNSTTGFLIPHLGRIKKIKMRTPINKESFEDRVIKKDLVNVDYEDGFFLFTKKKLMVFINI